MLGFELRHGDGSHRGALATPVTPRTGAVRGTEILACSPGPGTITDNTLDAAHVTPHPGARGRGDAQRSAAVELRVALFGPRPDLTRRALGRGRLEPVNSVYLALDGRSGAEGHGEEEDTDERWAHVSLAVESGRRCSLLSQHFNSKATIQWMSSFGG